MSKSYIISYTDRDIRDVVFEDGFPQFNDAKARALDLDRAHKGEVLIVRDGKIAGPVHTWRVRGGKVYMCD